MGKIKQEISAYKHCVDVYFNWHRHYNGEPIFDKSDGLFLKKMVTYIQNSYINTKGEQPTVDQTVQSFKLIFEMYDNWGFWKGKLWRVREIYSKLTGIINSIKESHGSKKTVASIEAERAERIRQAFNRA